MTTNPEVLRLAREVAASMRPYSHNSALVLDGERDGIDIVQVAIAAIERTKDLSVQFLRTDDGLETIAAFERYDHLRQPEKDTGTQAAIADYDRTMREEVIPKIDADLKAQGRAAHFLRLGIPDPCQSEKDNSDAD